MPLYHSPKKRGSGFEDITKKYEVRRSKYNLMGKKAQQKGDMQIIYNCETMHFMNKSN